MEAWMNSKHFLVIGAALLTTIALAQAPNVNDIISKLEITQKTIKDYRARVAGTAEQGEQKLKLDMEVQAIPAIDLVRIKFNAPDSLADNFIIIDKNVVSNYLFLTNQVTISKLNTSNVGGFNFNFSQFSSFSEQFPREKLNFKPVTTENTPDGRAFVVDASPKPGTNLEFGRVKIWVLDGAWRPQRLQYFDEKGAMIADMTVAKWEQNIGLKAADLRKLPKDAEIIRK
jgi:outer membrane lipoprotein-sorting protein